MRTRAITAMTALVTIAALGACSKSDNGAATDSTSMAPATTTTTTTSSGTADSSMAGMGTSATPMTHADSVRADSLRADSTKRADSASKSSKKKP